MSISSAFVSIRHCDDDWCVCCKLTVIFHSTGNCFDRIGRENFIQELIIIRKTHTRRTHVEVVCFGMPGEVWMTFPKMSQSFTENYRKNKCLIAYVIFDRFLQTHSTHAEFRSWLCCRNSLNKFFSLSLLPCFFHRKDVGVRMVGCENRFTSEMVINVGMKLCHPIPIPCSQRLLLEWNKIASCYLCAHHLVLFSIRVSYILCLL